uniref:Uncharacterized protein n=1 Tax=Arundo donax TaxID=35708 RepID=A0A0A9GWW7_ARUDO
MLDSVIYETIQTIRVIQEESEGSRI